MPAVLLLGASSDMSIAIARKFASENYSLQLAARNVDRLKPLQADLSVRSGIEATLHEFDAIDFRSHMNFVNSLPSLPEITICVFGYLGENETARSHWQEAEKIIHTNYTGAVSILNVISNRYAQEKRGVIVGISSVAGERGRQSNYIYGSAKAGFTAYLSGLRNRMVQENVHVLTVQPGFVYTRMTAGLKLPAMLTATPEEVANSVYKGVINKRDVVYVKWFWYWIMFVIRSIPEFIFKKLKL
ncbi:MAG TPA: SDR family oxidoreductase [Flavitalea sp.]|nr:SDR family oxidoreductase [Flavitalea sp.]